ISYWFWSRFLPGHGREFFLSEWLAREWFGVTGFDGAAGDVVLQLLVGVVFLATLPFVTRGLSWAHWGLDRALLGAFRTEQLEREVASLAESRSAAVAAEGAALRRLERDIHDGPQQRLVRLQ